MTGSTQRKRRPITDSMKVAVLRNYQAMVRCPGCGNTMPVGAVRFDHHLALVDGGTHTVENLRPLCIPCHAIKSAREHIANCKSKRLKRGPKKSKKPMGPSRGFDKTRTKKFSGEVVERGK